MTGVIPKLGWRYGLTYDGSSTESQGLITSFSPEYKAGLNANATIPLLRGFLWGEEWVQVRVTGLGQGIAHEDFRRQLMDSVQQIENAYWNLATRNLDLDVARKSLETARALLDQVNAQYEVGVVSRVEVVEAQAGVADREFRMIQAENQYRRAQDQLIDLVYGEQLRPATRLRIATSDSPESFQAFEVDETVAAEKAFSLRPELASMRRQVEQQRLQVKFSLNQRLPQLDLVGRYGYQGLAGKNQRPCVVGSVGFGGQVITSCPPEPPRRFGDADDRFLTPEAADQWSVGARLSIPIGNSTARANHRKSQVTLRQAQTREKRLEQSIILEVRDAVRNLRSAVQGIEAANRRVEAASEQLRAEQIRLEHGESTPFSVLQREEDLVEAESQKTGALKEYHDSVAALERAQGTILRGRGIVVEDALALR